MAIKETALVKETAMWRCSDSEESAMRGRRVFVFSQK
jgi:hypothetical protein